MLEYRDAIFCRDANTSFWNGIDNTNQLDIVERLE
jgi:hypothetical protein